jgi:tetratricopeptide (TPR) repeat protein
MAPSPDGNGTFADFYGAKMRDMFAALGINAKIYLASENYKNGIYNTGIKMMLDNVTKVRKVYEDMYKNPLKDDWFPLQVICPTCGKLGTTKVTDWDGQEVTFSCLPDLVKWAQGCGTTGKISPFDGNAKMPWKPEWSVKWYTFNVTIEWSGKDHMSKGSSFEVAANILQAVFDQKPPDARAYEFFLWNGKKMSSSKGLGLTGAELLEVLPPEVARFLMIKTDPNRAVEFNPKGTDIIPKLYDEYQKAAENYKQAFQIADEISYPPVQQNARNGLAETYLFKNDLVNARATIETALQYNVPNNNHNATALHGIIALRQGEWETAQEAFAKSIAQADEILAKTPDYYEALDAKGLALSALTICDLRLLIDGREELLAEAVETFRKAREIAPHAGVVKSVLRLFDELVKCDEEGALKDVRKAVEGS